MSDIGSSLPRQAIVRLHECWSLGQFLNNSVSPMPKKPKSPIPIEEIDEMIHTIRGVRVMLDGDQAKIYGVATSRFNQAIKRNRDRFPPDFHVSAYSRGIRLFEITICDVKTAQLIAIPPQPGALPRRFRLPTYR